MADAHATREANRGTMLQALAGKASSRSRAAIADSTRFANHGPPSSAGATAPNNSSRVASRSCRASRHLLQSAKCARPSPGKLSTSFSILATSTSAAELSSKSCSRSHSSLLRFNRFRMLPPCRSIPALLCQHYHPPSRAEKPHLYGVGIQFQQLRNLFNRKPFHFLQNQHQPVSLIQSFQQSLHALPRFEPFADIRRSAPLFLRSLDHSRLFLAQIRFVNQGPHLLFSQQVPAFIQSDLVQPGTERRPLVKPFQRKIRLYENLLRDVFHVFAPSQDPASHGKHPVLVAPYQFFKCPLILGLRPPDQFSVISASSRLESTPPLCRRHCWRAKGLYFWDACHGRLVTAIIPGLPEPAPSVSLSGF